MKSVFFLVPFRDSMLTKLLKNALGGNSKTIMVSVIAWSTCMTWFPPFWIYIVVHSDGTLQILIIVLALLLFYSFHYVKMILIFFLSDCCYQSCRHQLWGNSVNPQIWSAIILSWDEQKEELKDENSLEQFVHFQLIVPSKSSAKL